MKRVIRRTKDERKRRKVLTARLLSLAAEVFIGMGDTERRVRSLLTGTERIVTCRKAETIFSLYRVLLTAAWTHPSGSAMMYTHYTEVNQKRGSPQNLERWGVKLMLSSRVIAEGLYGGEWKVNYSRLEETSSELINLS